jgi:phosphopentomutase
MNKKRVIILMMDSLGGGSSEDSAKFNDEGSNPFFSRLGMYIGYDS